MIFLYVYPSSVTRSTGGCKMTLNTWKAVIALAALASVTLLLAIDAIDSTAGMPIITLIVGYVVGNGVAAKQGINAEPIIQKKNESN